MTGLETGTTRGTGAAWRRSAQPNSLLNRPGLSALSTPAAATRRVALELPRDQAQYQQHPLATKCIRVECYSFLDRDSLPTLHAFSGTRAWFAVAPAISAGSAFVKGGRFPSLCADGGPRLAVAHGLARSDADGSMLGLQTTTLGSLARDEGRESERFACLGLPTRLLGLVSRAVGRRRRWRLHSILASGLPCRSFSPPSHTDRIVLPSSERWGCRRARHGCIYGGRLGDPSFVTVLRCPPRRHCMSVNALARWPHSTSGPSVRSRLPGRHTVRLYPNIHGQPTALPAQPSYLCPIDG
uniref:Uncharacterized protein n=1 Tax=Mycena chlorophos TaxID=658473 RepID=A0ABQ0LLU5_MYCCL|nr:predicted protein [Mycena chlorophos]